VLTTPGGTITFNSDASDQFYLTEVSGLDGVPLRTPVDPVPFGDGGIVHDFWEGPRHVLMEGVLLIESTRIQNSILTIRNDMEEDLRVALASIKRDDGTLAWTPLGQSSRTLTVRNEVQLEMRHIENYLLRSFTFGLIAAEPDWV
jgi:hypothetical protein